MQEQKGGVLFGKSGPFTVLFYFILLKSGVLPRLGWGGGNPRPLPSPWLRACPTRSVPALLTPIYTPLNMLVRQYTDVFTQLYRDTSITPPRPGGSLNPDTGIRVPGAHIPATQTTPNMWAECIPNERGRLDNGYQGRIQEFLKGGGRVLEKAGP